MKICITSTGPNLDSGVDPRFGRCLYFIFIDDKKPSSAKTTGSKEKINVVPNAGVSAMRGAGIQAAQTVVNQETEVVITGNIGPNAFRVLNTSGVKIFQAMPGTKIKDVLAAFEQGQLSEITQAFGGGFGPPPGPPERGPTGGPGGSAGPGIGRGRRGRR